MAYGTVQIAYSRLAAEFCDANPRFEALIDAGIVDRHLGRLLDRATPSYGTQNHDARHTTCHAARVLRDTCLASDNSTGDRKSVV